MPCVWNGNLYGWTVDRNSRHSQKQFLHLDHWIQPPKSRECDKHIWSVVRLRFGPVTASLNSLIDLLWGTITASHNAATTCGQQIINKETITLSPLKKHMQNDMHQQIKGHVPLLFISLDPLSTIWTFMLLLLNTNINSEKMNLASISCSTCFMYITKIFQHGHYSLLAIC